jgi:hypothetical protein
MLEVDAADGVYGGREGTGPRNEAAASAAALGSKSRRLHCVVAERGVVVPSWSSCCNSSSDELAGLRSGFQTGTRGKHNKAHLQRQRAYLSQIYGTSVRLTR